MPIPFGKASRVLAIQVWEPSRLGAELLAATACARLENCWVARHRESAFGTGSWRSHFALLLQIPWTRLMFATAERLAQVRCGLLLKQTECDWTAQALTIKQEQHKKLPIRIKSIESSQETSFWSFMNSCAIGWKHLAMFCSSRCKPRCIRSSTASTFSLSTTQPCTRTWHASHVTIGVCARTVTSREGVTVPRRSSSPTLNWKQRSNDDRHLSTGKQKDEKTLTGFTRDVKHVCKWENDSLKYTSPVV